jgi:signal transduction histidine kinase
VRPRLTSVNDRAARIVAPATVALFGVIAVVLSQRPAGTVVAAGVALAVVLAGLAWRRPDGWPLVAGLVAAGALVTVICHDQPANLGWFAVCALAAWAGYVLPPRLAVVIGGAAVLMFVGEWLGSSDDPGWGAWTAGTLLSAVSLTMVRRQRLLLEQLREAQAGLAQRAAAEERNRIAHDLHDVIGHALTVSLLHITSARLALAEDPDEAGEALAEAERLSRRSLADVRAVVGLMKDPTATAPLPGVDQIGELVESFRRAGSVVECEVVGDLTRLTATKGLTVYRILQEALTNAVRHAPGSTALVRVEVDSDRTRVQVDSAGAPGPASVDGAGLAGMRERAEAMGGELSAGPAGSGWRVEAVLPG